MDKDSNPTSDGKFTFYKKDRTWVFNICNADEVMLPGMKLFSCYLQFSIHLATIGS